MAALSSEASKYRSRALLPHRGNEDGSGAVRTLADFALDALALNFARTRSTKGVPPFLVAALCSRLPPGLDPLLTMSEVHDPAYWERACAGRGWVVDVAQHGGSWQQAFAERFVADAVRRFGVYPEQPLTWDFDFLRPPMDGRHKHWERVHPGAKREREDGKPARERFCKNALDSGALGGVCFASSLHFFFFAALGFFSFHALFPSLLIVFFLFFLQRKWTVGSLPPPTAAGPTWSG